MSNILKNTFQEKVWLNWKLEKKIKDGVEKWTKVPYSVAGYKASSTDEKTWSSYDEAKAKSPGNIGIIFRPDQKLLGIDLDKCLKDGKIVHPEMEKIARLLYKADTYCEYSPSMTGLHLFLKVTESLPLITKKKSLPGGEAYECYTSGRFFTVTEKPYGIPKEVRTVTPVEAIELLSIIGYPWGKEAQSMQASGKSTQKTDNLGIDDQDLLKKIFESRNGAEVKALYDGDITKYNNDTSSADMALVSHLAFWTQKNGAQIERIWLASPLGAREKTQERADYRTRTIEAAIARCSNVYEKPEERKERVVKENEKELDLMWALDKQKNVVFIQNTENMCRILQRHERFAGKLRYDAFKNIMEIKSLKKGWRDIEDHDFLNIQTEISILFPFFAKVGKDMICDAVMKVCKDNAMDSAIDYITGIKWDGVKRLDSWLSNTYGVADDIYHQKIGANWMKGLVKRIIHPGCKFDYVLVLEGAQGTKKSTSLGVLGGDWHCETTMGTDNKDFFMQFQGKAIIEFSEGETLNRTEVKKMKAIITTQSDKYRPAYGRVSVDFPRRCVFAMTTNQEEYLKDETGNRRWLPVACQKTADVEWLRDNKDQLYAEAYQRVIVDEETTHEFPDDDMVKNQNERMIKDANTDTVCAWYQGLGMEKKNEGVTITQVYKEALHTGYTGKSMAKWEEMSIGSILRISLNLVRRQRMSDGIRAVRYFPQNAPEYMFTVEQPKDALEDFVSQKKLIEDKD